MAAAAGIEVVMIKATPGPVDKARAAIEKELAKIVEKGKLEKSAMDATMSRLHFTDKIDAVADCDLFLESIVEDIRTPNASSTAATWAAVVASSQATDT